jgi:hypothetical protein
MKVNDFRAICDREWVTNMAVVTEVHLDKPGYEELVTSLGVFWHGIGGGTFGGKVASLVNPYTAEPVPVTLHEPHLVVVRAPLPVEGLRRIVPL